MTLSLPEAFVERMRVQLGAEFNDFMASYDEPRHYGLRVNTLKLSISAFGRLSPFHLEKVSWAQAGYYYPEEDRPGKHPYYHAGMYYIQEPSAMAPAELLAAEPGDKVLDLCAAPGGKSTQIAAGLGGSGVLVANDNHPQRVKPLAKNLELSGAVNVVVLNEDPRRLAQVFVGYFDKILVDAPCSGEGMFRKDEDMVKQWSPQTVEKYAGMQREILDDAASMLAVGGRIVYSTCTFAPEENEGTIAAFLRRHPDFRLVPVPPRGGLSPGRPDWLAPAAGGTDAAAAALAGAVRLWPHRVRGEGHFAAVLERGEPAAGSAPASAAAALAAAPAPAPAAAAQPRTRAAGRREAAHPRGGRQGAASAAAAAAAAGEAACDAWRQFAAAQLRLAGHAPAGRLVAYGERVYLQPHGLPPLDGLKVVRPGWHLGALRKSRFEPSHALAMGLTAANSVRTLFLAADKPDAVRYLKGETLQVEPESIVRPDGVPAKGYCLVCIDGFPVGWGKWLEGILKNEYPPGWRWT